MKNAESVSTTNEIPIATAKTLRGSTPMSCTVTGESDVARSVRPSDVR
jgi:hypothetical protein